MLRITQIILFVFAIVCSSFTYLADTTTWSVGKSSDGITVYTRNYPNSAYKEFKAVMTVKSSMSCLLAIMQDIKSYPRWFYECPESYAIKILSNKEGYNYLTYKLPWPLESRDMVIHYWVSQDMKDKSVLIKTVGEGNYIATKENWVRIQDLTGFWKFTPKGNGMIEVHYQVHLEPNGSIPAWLANSTVVDAPFNTLLKMRDLIKEAKYANAKMDDIVEYQL